MFRVCEKALSHARQSRIHTGIGVSDIHISGSVYLKRERPYAYVIHLILTDCKDL